MTRPMQSQDAAAHAKLSLALWLPIVLMTAVALLAFHGCGFALRGDVFPPVIGTLLLGVATTRYLAARPGTHCFGMVAGIWFQAASIAGAALMLTYSAASLNRRLADALMLRMDHAMGYDWAAYVAWFTRHPHAAEFAVLCYNSNILQPALFVLVLMLSGHPDRLNKFVLVNIVTLLVATTIFAFLPVTTAWLHQGLSPDEIARFRFISGSDQGWVRELLRIRSGELRVLPPDFSEGLVGFPSFHAISALLNIWVIWPLRYWRWAVLPINTIMIAATPVFGGHYLADLVAGSVIAFASVVFVNRLYPTLAKYCAAPGESRWVPTAVAAKAPFLTARGTASPARCSTKSGSQL